MFFVFFLKVVKIDLSHFGKPVVIYESRMHGFKNEADRMLGPHTTIKLIVI